MFGLSPNQFGGILRAILPPAVAYVAAKGWIAAGSVNDVVTAVVAIAVAFWSVQTNKEPPKS